MVTALIARLPDTSMTHALMLGGPEHLGWGVDRHLRASEYDAINLNTRATGHWEKGKAPDFGSWPRPKPAERVTEEPKKATTVADLWAQFNGRKQHG